MWKWQQRDYKVEEANHVGKSTTLLPFGHPPCTWRHVMCSTYHAVTSCEMTSKLEPYDISSARTTLDLIGYVVRSCCSAENWKSLKSSPVSPVLLLTPLSVTSFFVLYLLLHKLCRGGRTSVSFWITSFWFTKLFTTNRIWRVIGIVTPPGLSGMHFA